MNFYTIQELKAAPDGLLQELARDGELVITSGGRPAALMLNLADGNVDERIMAIIEEEAQAAFQVGAMETPNAVTAAAMKDADEGRVTRCASIADMYAQAGVEKAASHAQS